MCCSADSDIVLLRTKTAPPSESDCRYYTTARAVVVSALMPRRGGPKARARPGKCAFRPEAGKMHEISNLFLQPYAPDDPQSRPRPETDGGGRQATAGCGEIFSNIVRAPGRLWTVKGEGE